MTNGLGVPAVIQNEYQTDVDAMVTEIRDLGRRAGAFDQLMGSARGCRYDGERIHPDVDTAAWVAAVEVHATPREGVTR